MKHPNIGLEAIQRSINVLMAFERQLMFFEREERKRRRRRRRTRRRRRMVEMREYGGWKRADGKGRR